MKHIGRTGGARRFAGAGLLALAAALSPASAQDAATLRQKATTMQERFASNAFGRPLVLESTETSGDLKGDVYTIVEHPFPVVVQSLKTIDNWCDILILHLNVKRCREAAAERKLILEIGRKFDQPIENAHKLQFDFKIPAATADYLQVLLTADSGPFGTSNYRIFVEAVPLEGRKSLIHMSYSYAYGLTARLAIQTYLATLGSEKVGFTIVDRKDGKPVYVGGIVGLLERNTMRYYLAIDAYLSATSLPAAEQFERRIRTWYSITERYAEQLREMEQAEYLEMKRKEMKRQQAS